MREHPPRVICGFRILTAGDEAGTVRGIILYAYSHISISRDVFLSRAAGAYAPALACGFTARA